MTTKPKIVWHHIKIWSWIPQGARRQDGRTDWPTVSYEVTQTQTPRTSALKMEAARSSETLICNHHAAPQPIKSRLLCYTSQSLSQLIWR